MTNNEFRKDEFFRKCCEKAGVLPTTRQASKFRNDKGSARKVAVTVRREMKENEKVIQQVANKSKEQAMIGGIEVALHDAVIDSLDVHQNLATQVLKEDRIRKGLADIVYGLIAKGISAS